MEEIGVVGTGTLGCQISQLIAQNGFSVTLKSRKQASLDSAMEKIQVNLEKKLSLQEAQGVLQRIHGTTKFQDLTHAPIVIECIIEDQAAKEKLFKELSSYCPPNAVLATNTSCLSINQLASVATNPSRVIGAHFFNPVTRTKLVEVIKARSTSEKTVRAVKDFVKKLGKTAIIMDDSPGFIVNRLLFLMINEAGYLLEEGNVTMEQIDSAMKLGTNVPMGPFEIADFVGIDVTLQILNELHMEASTKKPAKIFVDMVAQSKLGRKTKEGFYKY